MHTFCFTIRFFVLCSAFLNIPLIASITPEQIKSLDVRMFCYAFVAHNRVTRLSMSPDIQATIATAVHNILEHANHSQAGGVYSKRDYPCGCDVYWAQRNGHLKFSGFGYNRDDWVEGMPPKIPPYPFIGGDGREVIGQRFYKEQAPSKICQPRVSVPIYQCSKPNSTNWILESIRKNVNFGVLVNPTFLDRWMAERAHQKSGKSACITTEIHTWSPPSEPQPYSEGLLSRAEQEQRNRATVVDHKRIFDPYLAFFGPEGEALVLTRFELYHYKSFQDYLRTLPSYSDFIIDFADALQADKKLRKQFAHVEGFKKKSFCNWVTTQAAAAKQQRAEAAQEAYVNQQYSKIAQTFTTISTKKAAWLRDQEQQQTLNRVDIKFPESEIFDRLYDSFLEYGETSHEASQEYKLAQFGFTCLEHAFQDTQDQGKWRDRTLVVNAYLDDPHRILERHYVFDTPTKLLLGSEGMMDYEHYTGNALQIHLYDELVSTLKASAQLYDAYQTDPYIRNYVSLTRLITDRARDCTVTQNYELGFSLADVAEQMTTTGSQWAKLTELGFWAFYKPCEAIAVGLVEGCSRIVKNCEHAILNPVEATTDFFNGLSHLSNLVARTTFLFFVDQPQLCDDIKQVMDHVSATIIKDPCGALSGTIASGIEMWFTNKVSTAFLKNTLTIKAALSEIMTTEAGLAEMAFANAAKEVIEHPNAIKCFKPLETAAHEVSTTAATVTITAREAEQAAKTLVTTTAASNAANDASLIFIKNKHLNLGNGSFSKFATNEISVAQGWVQQALCSSEAQFLPNPQLPGL